MPAPAKTQLGMFAKYWSPGQVKTRLAASIGNELAATLHRVNIETLVCRFGTRPNPCAEHHVLAISPWDHHAEFQSMLDVTRKDHASVTWELRPQSSGGLGQRMKAYFDEAFQEGRERIVLIGSDSPTIPDAVVEHAFEALCVHDVVLGPADDGGYYLVGARGKTPSIFENIDWSSERVWHQTVQRLDDQSVSWSTLSRGYDIDRLADLRRLSDELNRPGYATPVWQRLREVARQILSNPESSRE